MNKKQIVCISTHHWHGAWFRKQHFMSRFAEKGYEIIYIDPYYSLLRKLLNDMKSLVKLKVNNVLLIKEQDNILVLKPPLGIPLSRTIGLLNRINCYYLAKRLNIILKRLNFDNYILWLYDPSCVLMLDHLNYGKLVFDLVDDIPSGFKKNSRKYKLIKRNIEIAIKKSDLFLTTAWTLFNDYRNMAVHSKAYWIPNGYEPKIFSELRYEIPFDLRMIKHPIIGFHGALFKYLDYNLIKFLIKKNADKSFVFLGDLKKEARKKWEKIIKYENVFWLGNISQQNIPKYLSHFDVCINPFKVDKLSRSVNPLKVYECLACKKAVVSVRMESLEKESIAKFILFANNYDEFNKLIDVAIKTGSVKICKKILKKYSWDHLFSRVYHLTKNILK